MRRWIALAVIGAAAPSPAAPRSLSLAQAVDLAMAVNPVVAQAHIAEDRGKLAVLRAQLDRVSVKVDGALQEYWTKQNIGGPTQYVCTLDGITFGSDPDGCTSMGGVAMPASVQAPSAGLGLFNVQAQVVAPVFSGFRVSSNVKRAQLGHEASLVQIRQSRKDTALAVARAYWSVRRLQLAGDVHRAALAGLRDAEEIAGGRMRAGLAAPIDLNRARSRRLQEEATIADLDGQARETLAQFAVSLALAGDVVLTDQPAFPESPPPPVEELLDEAKRARPELLGARLQREAQHQAVRIAQSGFYPQLAAYGLLQFGNNPYLPGSGARSFSTAANPFQGVAGNLTLGATMSMNFLDTLNTWTSTKDAKYEEARLGEEERRLERIVEADVRYSHARLGHLYAQRAPLLSARDVARDNVAILAGRYRNGDALVIELLDGQNDLAGIEAQLADLSGQLQLAWIELDAALGRVVGGTQ